MPLADVLDSTVGEGDLAVENSLKKVLVAEEEVPPSDRARSGGGRNGDLKRAVPNVAADEDAPGLGFGRRAYVCRDSRANARSDKNAFSHARTLGSRGGARTGQREAREARACVGP
ncbi:MAG: hypothetical protein V7607_6101 [Solirubrobacteraceae bacterium]